MPTLIPVDTDSRQGFRVVNHGRGDSRHTQFATTVDLHVSSNTMARGWSTNTMFPFTSQLVPWRTVKPWVGDGVHVEAAGIVGVEGTGVC